MIENPFYVRQHVFYGYVFYVFYGCSSLEYFYFLFLKTNLGILCEKLEGLAK